MNYLIQNAVAVFSSENPKATDIRIQGGRITELGCNLVPSREAPETLVNARGCVVWPGLVNTHHHLVQSVLKGVPEALNQGLGQWLGNVPFRFWPRVTPDLMYHAARLGLYELIRSGATTCADHHYLYHRTTSPELEEAVWQAAEEMGIRLVLCRGSATEQGSHEGMRKSGITPESLDQVINRLDATSTKHHQPGPNAMKKLVVAPTSLIHSSSPEGLRHQARWAREQKLRLHSHLLDVSYD